MGFPAGTFTAKYGRRLMGKKCVIFQREVSLRVNHDAVLGSDDLLHAESGKIGKESHWEHG
jgi:hypothetical protein